jgi:PAS domain S-box-containing protein
MNGADADTTRRTSELRLQLALDAARMGSWEIDPADESIECSVAHRALYGLAPDEPVTLARLFEIIHPDDRLRIREAVLASVRAQRDFSIEYRVRWSDGSLHWLAGRGRSLYDTDGRPVKRLGVTWDITERKAAEQFDAEQRRVLERIAAGRPLRECLEALTEAAGRLCDGVRAAVLVPQERGDAMGEAFSAQLAPSFAAGIHGAPIGAVEIGTCGTAIFRGEAVACSDIATSTRWAAPWRELCLAHGIVACHSTPALGASGRPIASFMLCLAERRGPSPFELRVAAFGAHAAGIAIARDGDERRLRDSERELREQVADLTLLHSITARWTADRERQTVLDELLGGALAMTGAAKGMLTLVDAQRGDLVRVSSAGLGPASLALVERVPRGAGASGQCYARGERVVVQDTDSDPIFEPYREAARIGGYRSAHATPLLGRDDRVLGVLTLFGTEPGHPSERQTRLADLLARQAAAWLDHLRLQQELRSGEERFREMADSAPAMLWVTDVHGSLTFISRGWFEHTGQSERQAYAGGDGWTWMVHPEDRAGARRSFLEAAEQRTPFEIEYRLQRADGSWRWAIDTGRPRFADDGTWLGYIGAVIDVHERIEAREALLIADRRKDEFLATLAHELRNPLAPIRNSLHLLGLSGSTQHASRVHEMLDRQVNHLVRLVDDLMEASRISRGQLDLRREVLELSQVLLTAVETSRPLIDRAGHQLAVSMPGHPMPVDGDAVRLAQVFANLLNNAAKFTDEGGRIELVAGIEQRSVLVSVRDSGVGIAPEHRPRLFEMFSQLDSDRARSHGGLGIGLSLARRLVQLHGGSIEAFSGGVGCGSRFTVRLPLATGAGLAHVPPQAGAALDERRILVVDDNRDAADSLAMLLRYLGAEVRVEYGGSAAVAAAVEWRPSVALLDLGMPGMDGFAVARALRDQPSLAGLRLIALTGWGQEADRQRTREGRFDHHLIKPVDIAVLQTLLASMRDRPTAVGGPPDPG